MIESAKKKYRTYSCREEYFGMARQLKICAELAEY